ISFRLLYATTANASEIINQLANPAGVKVTELEIDREHHAPTLAPGDPSAGEGLPLPVADTIRVQLSELDDLIAMTSALFRDTTNLLELSAANADSPSAHAGT